MTFIYHLKENTVLNILKYFNCTELHAKIVIQLLLLPHLILPRGRIYLKKHYKPSISKCKDSIILYAKSMSIRIDNTTYIIVVGITLAEINAFYICIDTILYQVSIALAALDLCFKIFHVFDVTYLLIENKHIWYIIQLCLYKFLIKFDKQS
ncbi:hypothetical protein P5V15_002550 [Pogonomyrmex californicus]